MVISFADEEQSGKWDPRLRAALRLLADSGFGGERSRGWGHAEQPEFIEGALPEMILPQPAEPSTSWWLLSLFSPAAEDRVTWDRGNYDVVTRGGRVQSPAGSGQLKKLARMLVEGSVVVASESPRGAAPDVAPDAFPHPVYRAGFAVAIPLPAQVQP